MRLLASADIKADEKGLIRAAEELGVSIRFISSDEIRLSRRDFRRSEFAGKSKFARSGRAGGPAGGEEDKINPTQDHPERRDGGHRPGKLFVVGIGPGGPLDRTPRAEEAIARSSVIVGYRRYLELVADLTRGRRSSPRG